jgi:hypothetical protein
MACETQLAAAQYVMIICRLQRVLLKTAWPAWAGRAMRGLSWRPSRLRCAAYPLPCVHAVESRAYLQVMKSIVKSDSIGRFVGKAPSASDAAPRAPSALRPRASAGDAWS